jgi:hypothetical protein
MIGSVVDIDTSKPDVLAMPPDFIGCGLQYRGDVSGTNPPKPVSLHLDIERFRGQRGSIVSCSNRAAHSEEKRVASEANEPRSRAAKELAEPQKGTSDFRSLDY